MSTEKGIVRGLRGAAAVFVSLACLISPLPAFAQAEAPKDTLRPEIAKPLQPLQELIKEKKFPEALAKIREADAVANKTPYEQYVVDRMYGAVGVGSGDNVMAAKAIEAVIKSAHLPAAEKTRFTEALVATFMRLKDYANVTRWAREAVKDPAVQMETRLALAQSYYLANDFANAATEFRGLVARAEAAGEKPPQDQLRLIAASSHKINDNVGYAAVLEKLVTHYPSKEYWTDLIYRIETQKTFSDRLLLDSYRLKFALGLLSVANEFIDMAELSIQAGLPVEALKVLDQGFADGILGKEGDLARQKKMREAAAKEVAEEKKRAAKGDASAAKTGQALLNNGFDLVLKGDAPKGLEMMAKGITMADVKRPDDARLRYGIALVLAGEKVKALDVFKTVTGNDGGADLARLWSLYATQKAT